MLQPSLQLFYFMEYYQFIFEPLPLIQQEILLALLDNIGFTGFEEEDGRLKAFINKDQLWADEFDKIISINNIKYSRSIIKEINWNEKWEAGFEPVTVLFTGTNRPFVHLRAGFHPPDHLSAYDIEVTPKMSFGTGHHDTTYMMVEQMSRLNFRDEAVIDFGTGTGVLAILAEKLGAGSVLAIDNDDWSIQNSGENIQRNDCSKISLLLADSFPSGSRASIILANINLNVIIAALDEILLAALPGASLLFSGMMKQDEPIILKSLELKNVEILEVHYRNEWLIIRAKVNPALVLKGE